MPSEVTVQERVNGYDVELVVTTTDGRLTAREIRVSQVPEGPPVTGTALRSIPVAALTKLAVAAALEVESNPDGAGVRMSALLLTPEVATRLRVGGPTDETLAWVARIYRLALLAGDPPTKVVETALALPRSTAGRWVAQARRRGYLGPSDGRGKAGG